jgi:exosortase
LALVFLLPVPGMIRSSIALPLQSMATSVTHACLETFGFQAAKAGNLLIINGEQVAVAEACNGMRLVFSLTLVVYAFAFSMPLRPSVRIGLIVLSPLVALIANVIRLVPTALLYGYANHDVADTFHDLSGWLMLFVALGILWGVVSILRWVEIPVAPYEVAPE